MSCPSCQLGGRRLPSLPLGYSNNNKVKLFYKDFRNSDLHHKKFTIQPIESASVRKTTYLSLEDHEGLEDYLIEHSNVISEFVVKHISQDEIEKWLLQKCKIEKSDDKNRSFSKWKFCVHKDKRNVLDSLTKDVYKEKKKSEIVNELAKNVADAVHADRFSLYLVDETESLLRTYANESIDDLKAPFQHIATSNTVSAFVAKEKKSVFVKEVLGDDRFPSGTGKEGTDQSVICHPINLSNGKLYGVLEFVKTADSIPFDERDLEITFSYLSWGNIAVNYSEIIAQVKSHSKIEDFSRKCARYVMKNTTFKFLSEYVMNFAQEATDSSFYILYTLNDSKDKLINLSTNIKDDNGDLIQLRLPVDKCIPGRVVSTGETVNVKDAYSCSYFSRDTDVLTGFTTKTVLAVPLLKNNSIAGVVQLINKRSGVYDEKDLNILKLCVAFCSIAMFLEENRNAIFKKDFELDILKEIIRHHGTPKEESIREIVNPTIHTELPEDFYKLSFNCYHNTSQFGHWFIIMAKDMFDQSGLKYGEDVLIRFTATVQNYYRDVPYHNWIHAFSVAHFMYVLLREIGDKIPPLEGLAMFIACICHDLDHRGRNNAFCQNTEHPLSQLYASSIMERHHIYVTKFILEDEQLDIFLFADEQQRQLIEAVMDKCIIATDLLNSFSNRDKLEKRITGNVFCWGEEDDRCLSSYVMMTICDLCAACKPWEIHQYSAIKVFDEFFEQADEEKSLGLTPIPMFTDKTQLPINQIGFLNGIVKPCVTVLRSIIPALEEIQQQIEFSRHQWEELAKENFESSDLVKEKFEELNVYGSKLQEKSLSFVKYNLPTVNN